MKSLFCFALTLGFCLGSAFADETVQTVQKKLAQEGLCHGKATGVYDSDTSAAVTRYQIRRGLAITGKLNAETLKSLRVPPPSSFFEHAAPSPVAETWRQLRKEDSQFLKKLNEGDIPAPEPSTTPSPHAAARAPVAAEAGSQRPKLAQQPAPRPPAQDSRTALTANSRGGRNASKTEAVNPERLRDYVGAFVLAGLDPQVGAELEFFAGRVNYFGESNVPREKIRRDLVRYDQRWPERRFWLAGDLEVQALPGGRVRVVFPLRYELNGHGERASGEVFKTLLLRPTVNGDFEIVAVSEIRKGRKQKTES
jgi:peptidoglycan hydrolase-like protein with peptidoglycan-binding domain